MRLDRIQSTPTKTPADSQSVARKRPSISQQKSWWKLEQHPSLGQLADFTRDLRSLLEAGQELPTALGYLEKESEYKALRRWCELTRTAWREGRELTYRTETPGLRMLQDFFAASRRGSDLKSLVQIADNIFERQKTANAVMVQSLAYPIALLFLGVAACVALCAFIAPQLLVLFPEDATPAGLSVMAGIGSFLRLMYPYIFGAMAIACCGLLIAQRNRALSLFLSRLTRAVPIIGAALNRFDEIAFAQVWSAYIGAGMGIDRSLRAIAGLTPALLESPRERVLMRVRDGQSIDQAISTEIAFSEDLKRAVRMGRASGKLRDSLQKTAQSMQERALAKLRRQVTVLAPLIIAFVAGMAATLMISLMNALSGLGGEF